VRDRDVEDSSRVAVIVLASYFVDANSHIRIFVKDQELLVICDLSANDDVWWVVLDHIRILVSKPVLLNLLEFFTLFTLCFFISI
jgi:hypothetical protein